MPFIPHTEDDIKAMKATCQIDTLEALFDEIPKHLRRSPLDGMSTGMNEMQISQQMHARAKKDSLHLNFVGAGAYEHYIPKAVWDLAGRGEFLTAYTPYQAEASQGTLQLLWEFQTMMASLMSLDVSNASLYEGATALAEAILMLVRTERQIQDQKFLVPNSLNPFYRDVLRTLVSRQGISLVEVPYHVEKGTMDLKALEALVTEAATPFQGLIISQPNFFGALEPVDKLTDWATGRGIPVIGVVNPLAMAWLKPPGQWGEEGAAIACGEAQPLGIPLSGGGPYCGFIACKEAYLRQLPGRLVGSSLDRQGRVGYTLTLQAREQHIRRAKATSSICTNQGLLVTAATIYMSLLGPDGLKNVAMASHQNLMSLKSKLKAAVPQLKPIFSAIHFHEMAFQVPKPVSSILEKLSMAGIDAGLHLAHYYPELEQGLLICVTETKTETDLDKFCEALKQALR